MVKNFYSLFQFHYFTFNYLGVICEDYVVCPWHAACFNIYTGEIEEYPGCNNIPVFNVNELFFVKNKIEMKLLTIFFP